MSNSWPRWSPFVQKLGNDTFYWLTFSSVRDYGTRLLNSQAADFDHMAPQVWMAGFDVTKAEAGKDPSLPPFWLPFQSIDDHNHIAQWTQKIVAIQ